MVLIFRIAALGFILITLAIADERSLPVIFPETVYASDKRAALENDPAAKKLTELLDPAQRYSLEEAAILAGRDRARMIAILYEYLGDKRLQRETGRYYPELMQALLRLGDKRGMQLLAERLRTDPGYRQSDIPGAEITEALERAAQPAVIPYLAPLLFINESPEWDITIDGDIPTGDKISFQVANMIQKVLVRAEVLPWQVKEWSRRLKSPNVTRGEYREILREWWRSNQNAFERKDYAAVRPGREWQAVETKEPAPPSALPEPTIATRPVTPEQTPSVIATAPPDSQPLWIFVAGAVLAVAALVSLLCFWRARA